MSPEQASKQNSVCMVTYHTVGNLRGYAADHHENVGVVYQNAGNEVQTATKITVFELSEFFTLRKLPAIRYHNVMIF